MKERMCFTADSSFAQDDSGSAFAVVRTMTACTADEQTQGDMRSATMQLNEKNERNGCQHCLRKHAGLHYNEDDYL